MAPARRSTRKTAEAGQPVEVSSPTTRAGRPAARGKKVAEPQPGPEPEKKNEEQGEEVTTPQARGTKRKVAENKTAPSKRTRRNAPVEEEEEEQEQEQEQEQETIAEVPATKSPGGRSAEVVVEVEIHNTKSRRGKTSKAAPKPEEQREQEEEVPVQPVKSSRGRKSKTVLEPEQEKEEEKQVQEEEVPITVPVKKGRGRKTKAASEPEPEEQHEKEQEQEEETPVTQPAKRRGGRKTKAAPEPVPEEEPQEKQEEEVSITVPAKKTRSRKTKAAQKPELEAEPEEEQEQEKEFPAAVEPAEPKGRRGRAAAKIETEIVAQPAQSARNTRRAKNPAEPEEQEETPQLREPSTSRGRATRSRKGAEPLSEPVLPPVEKPAEEPESQEQEENSQPRQPSASQGQAKRGRKGAVPLPDSVPESVKEPQVSEPSTSRGRATRGRKGAEPLSEPAFSPVEKNAGELESEPEPESEPITKGRKGKATPAVSVARKTRGRKAVEPGPKPEVETKANEQPEEVHEEPAEEAVEPEPVARGATRGRRRSAANTTTRKTASRGRKAVQLEPEPEPEPEPKPELEAEEPVQADPEEEQQEVAAEAFEPAKPARATRGINAVAPKPVPKSARATKSQPVKNLEEDKPEAEGSHVSEVKPTRRRDRKVKKETSAPEIQPDADSEHVPELEPEETQREPDPPETNEAPEPATKRRGRKLAPKTTQSTKPAVAEEPEEAGIDAEAPPVETKKRSRKGKEVVREPAEAPVEPSISSKIEVVITTPKKSAQPGPEEAQESSRKGREVAIEADEDDHEEKVETAPKHSTRTGRTASRRGGRGKNGPSVARPSRRTTLAEEPAVEEPVAEEPVTEVKDVQMEDAEPAKDTEPEVLGSMEKGQGESVGLPASPGPKGVEIRDESVAEPEPESEVEDGRMGEGQTERDGLPAPPKPGVEGVEIDEDRTKRDGLPAPPEALEDTGRIDSPAPHESVADTTAVTNAPESVGASTSVPEGDVEMKLGEQGESASATGTPAAKQTMQLPSSSLPETDTPAHRTSPARVEAPVLSSPLPNVTPKNSPQKRILSPLVSTPYNRFVSNGSSPLQHSPVLPSSPFAARLPGGGESPVKSPVPMASTPIKVLSPAHSSPSGSAAKVPEVEENKEENVAEGRQDTMEEDLVETTISTKELEPMSSPIMMPPSTPLALSGNGKSPVKQSPAVVASPLVARSEFGSESFIGLAGMQVDQGASPSKKAVSFAHSPLAAGALYRSPDKGTSSGGALGFASEIKLAGSPLRGEAEEEEETDEDERKERIKPSPRKRQVTTDGSFSRWSDGEEEEDVGIPENTIEANTPEPQVEKEFGEGREKGPESLEKEGGTGDSSFNRWLEGDSGYTDVEPTMGEDEERDEFPRYPEDDSLMLPQNLTNITTTGSGSKEREKKDSHFAEEDMTLQFPSIHGTNDSESAATTEGRVAEAALIMSQVSDEYSLLEEVRPDITGRHSSPSKTLRADKTTTDEDMLDTSTNFSMVSGISRFLEMKEAETSSLLPGTEGTEEKGKTVIPPAESSGSVEAAAAVAPPPPQGNRPVLKASADVDAEAAAGADHQAITIDSAVSSELVRTTDSFVSSPPVHGDSVLGGLEPVTPLAANSSIGQAQVDLSVDTPATPKKRRTSGLLSLTTGPGRRSHLYDIQPTRLYASSPVKKPHSDSPVKPVKPFVLRKAAKEDPSDADEAFEDEEADEILSEIDPDERLLTPADLLEDSGLSSPPSIWSSFDLSFNRGLLEQEEEEENDNIIGEEVAEEPEEELPGVYDEDKGPAIEFDEYKAEFGDDSVLEEIAALAGDDMKEVSKEGSYGEDIDSATSEYGKQIVRPDNPTLEKSAGFAQEVSYAEDFDSTTSEYRRHIVQPDNLTPSKATPTFGTLGEFPSLAPPATSRDEALDDEWFSSPFPEEVGPLSPAKRTESPLRKQLFRSPAKNVHFNEAVEFGLRAEYTEESGETTFAKTPDTSLQEEGDILDSVTAINTELNALPLSPSRSVHFNEMIELEYTAESGETSFSKNPNVLTQEESAESEEVEVPEPFEAIATDPADTTGGPPIPSSVPQVLDALDSTKVPLAKRRQTTGSFKQRAKKDTRFGRMGISPGKGLQQAAKGQEAGEPEKDDDDTTGIGNKHSAGHKTSQFMNPPQPPLQAQPEPTPLAQASTTTSATPSATSSATALRKTPSSTRKTLRARVTPGTLKKEGVEEALRKYTPSSQRFLKWHPGALYQSQLGEQGQKRRHTVDPSSAAEEQQSKRRKSYAGNDIKQLGTVEDPFAPAPEPTRRLSLRQSYLTATPSAKRAKAELQRRKLSEIFGEPLESAQSPKSIPVSASPPATLAASDGFDVADEFCRFQALAKGLVTRRRTMQMVNVRRVILAQSLWRMRVTRREYLVVQQAAIILQRAWRRRQEIIEAFVRAASSPEKSTSALATTQDSPGMTSFFDDFLNRHDANKKKKAEETLSAPEQSTSGSELPAPEVEQAAPEASVSKPASLLPVPARAQADPPDHPIKSTAKSKMPVRRVHQAKKLLFPQQVEPSSSGSHSSASTPEKRKADDEPVKRTSKRIQLEKEKSASSIPKPKRIPKPTKPFSLKPLTPAKGKTFLTKDEMVRITRENTIKNRSFYCDFVVVPTTRDTPKPPSPDAKSQALAAAAARRKRAVIEAETGVILGPGDDEDWRPQAPEGRKVHFIETLEMEAERSSPRDVKGKKPEKGIMAPLYKMDEFGNVPGADRPISDPEQLKELLVQVKISRFIYPGKKGKGINLGPYEEEDE